MSETAGIEEPVAIPESDIEDELELSVEEWIERMLS